MVIREGEVSREMYFIKSGAAQAGTLLAGPAGQTLTFNVFSAMNLLRLHAQQYCAQPFILIDQLFINIYL